MSKRLSPESSPTVPLQSGRGEEPGVVLPAALLRPLQTGRHRLDAAVPARPRPADVRPHRHGLTSPPRLAQGQRSDSYSGSGPKAQSVFIYFFNGLAPCEERPPYQKSGKHKALCRYC